MTELEIKHLQSEKRFSDSGLKLFWLIFYSPVGLVIVVLRLLLAIVIWMLGTLLPDISVTKNLLNKLSCALFGIIVHVENADAKRNVRVYVSNQISPLDHFVVHTVANCVTPCTSNSSPQLLYSLGLKTFGSSTNMDEIKKCIGSHISTNKTPVLFQPECKVTNGRGILKFKDWPFSFTNEVQPVFLKVRRPFFDVSVSTIDASYWHDMFWYLFSPWTVYNVYFLSVVERNELDDAQFGEKVREQIASELEVEACPYSAADLNEWEKRYLVEQRRARIVQGTPASPVQSNNPELHRMTRQVKEVLPTVPYNVIFKEIVRTKNIDVTITNILEGHISYVPEVVPASPSPSPSSSSTSPSPGPLNVSCSRDIYNTAASTFPKSAQERMQSFQERKLQLIATARQRYIEKHGLDVNDSNTC